jgi:predicted RNA-binding protein with PUA-like domain
MSGAAAARWLVKTEPSTYAFADLAREGRTAWTGVKNATAQIHLARMAAGDEVLVYHTGAEKAVVGRERVARAAYPDPTQSGRLVCVDLVPVAPLGRPVALADIRAEPSLATFDLVRQSRLSVMPVPEAAARWIAARARA